MNKCIKYITLAVFCCLAYSSARAQTVTDRFFPNPNGAVRAIVQQTNGQMVIAGNFSKINTTDKSYIGRINIDGSLDTAFTASADGVVSCLARQSDDKIIVGGEFVNMNGQGRKHLARLDADGSLDVSFNPSVEGAVAYGVYAIAIQSDGKILVGGEFTSLAGQTCTRIGRLNTDGSYDTSFNASSDGTVMHIAVQSDGKIIIAGLFTTINGQSRTCLARLNTDGTLDSSFSPNPNNTVCAAHVQPDGKIIVAGDFTKIAAVDLNRIARLNSDGSLDTTFNPGTGAGSAIYRMLIQPNGKIVIGGAFVLFNSAAHIRAVRLNPNGSVDTTFNIGEGFNNDVLCLYQQTDGKIVAGGLFTQFFSADYSRPYLLRMHECEGKPDGTLAYNTPLNTFVYAVAAQRNERLLIGGSFTTVDGADHQRIARIYPHRDVDSAFTASAVGGVLLNIVVQPDDMIILGGFFTTVNSETHTYIARLISDGTIDPSFTPGILDDAVRGIALQPDGKIIIGGLFSSINGASYNCLARLNTNGTADTSFNPGAGVVAPGYINSVAIQTDGKVLVGGSFSSLAGQSRNNIGRLNTDGSPDSAFNPDANLEVTCVTVQPDGKILVGGFFTTVGGVAHNTITRLDTNGNVDASFNLPGGANNAIYSIALQCDGKMTVCGSFTTIGGDATHKNIAHLNSDGSLDTSFSFAENPISSVMAAMIQNDGKIVCGGLFANWTDVWHDYFARVATTHAAIQSLSVSSIGNSVTWLRSGASPELTRCIFEYSSDGTTWSQMGDGTRVTGGWQIGGLDLPLNTNFYVRATGLYCGGCYNASGSVLDSTKLVYLIPPRVVITNVSGVITGYYGAVNYTLSGTNNANITSTMWWTNSLGGGASFAATNPWLVTVTGLIVGANTITVYGSNIVGDASSNSITIVQRRNDYMAADSDGDRLADPAYCNGTNWYEWPSSLYYNRASHAYGMAGTFPVLADFDGDRFADPGVYNNQTGKWYLWLSTYSYWQVGPLSYGMVGAAPVPADFDGDRKADFAVYAAGVWYAWLSTADYAGFGPFNFGLADAIPAAGDFDGDAKADPVIFLRGNWYAWLSSIAYYGVGPVAYGEAEAFPVAADFDGDNVCDLATVKESVWNVWLSTIAYQQLGPFTFTAEGWSFLPDSSL